MEDKQSIFINTYKKNVQTATREKPGYTKEA